MIQTVLHEFELRPRNPAAWPSGIDVQDIDPDERELVLVKVTLHASVSEARREAIRRFAEDGVGSGVPGQQAKRQFACSGVVGVDFDLKASTDLGQGEPPPEPPKPFRFRPPGFP